MNKRLLLALASVAALATAVPNHALAEAGQPAPEIALLGAKSLKALRGQPVVLIVAPSPRSRAFRKQVKRIESDYQGFAARGTIFVGVFTEQEGDGVRSSIPFTVAKNGATAASTLGVTTPFAVVVVGIDGNIDLQTRKVATVSRLRDAVLNNAELQAAERRL